MLAHHCPDCKVPLFEKDGRIFCPSCGREAVFEEDVSEKDVEVVKKTDESTESGKERKDVQRKLEEAISKICDMIVSAKTPEEVKGLSESVEKLASVLEKLRRE